jgi:hypothetical protein
MLQSHMFYVCTVSGIEYESPNISPYLCCCFIEKYLQVLLQIFLGAYFFWISTKPCLAPAEEMHAYICTNMDTNIYTTVSVITRYSVNLRIYSGLENRMLY